MARRRKVNIFAMKDRCENCHHRCPEDRVCVKCGSDPMVEGDTLCVDCDDAWRLSDSYPYAAFARDPDDELDYLIEENKL